MRGLLILLSVLAIGEGALAADLTAYARARPPELIDEDGVVAGPLKDILDEAASAIDTSVTWVDVPFVRALKDLQNHQPIIVPRLRRTADREAYVTFLGPIAMQKRHIDFYVRKGEEGRVTGYDDLYKLTIGVKRGTAYFEPFDTEMLDADRIDTIIVIDPPAIEAKLRENHITRFAVAPYHLDHLEGNYYGIAKDGPLSPLAPALDAVFKSMVASGRVRDIYGKYGLIPEDVVP
jgi:polar amino acid transport system substrate-binding protein